MIIIFCEIDVVAKFKRDYTKRDLKYRQRLQCFWLTAWSTTVGRVLLMLPGRRVL